MEQIKFKRLDMEKKKRETKTDLPKAVRDYFSEIGRRGGSSTSEAKKKSSAANGRLGGRPKGSLGKKKREEEAGNEKIS